jgi:hypothetical protein
LSCRKNRFIQLSTCFVNFKREKKNVGRNVLLVVHHKDVISHLFDVGWSREKVKVKTYSHQECVSWGLFVYNPSNNCWQIFSLVLRSRDINLVIFFDIILRLFIDIYQIASVQFMSPIICVIACVENIQSAKNKVILKLREEATFWAALQIFFFHRKNKAVREEEDVIEHIEHDKLQMIIPKVASSFRICGICLSTLVCV